MKEVSIEELLTKAKEALQKDQTESARKTYRQIIDIDPRHAEANRALGSMALEAGLVNQAVPLFKTALESEPTAGHFWLSYIDALYRSGNHESARSVLRQGVARGLKGDAVDRIAGQLSLPDGGAPCLRDRQIVLYDVSLEPAISLRESGDYERSIDWLNKHSLKESTVDASALALLAHLHLLRKELNSAEAALQRAADISSAHPAVRLNYARLYSIKGDLQKALALALDASELASQDIEPVLVLASIYIGLGRDSAAASKLEQAFRINDESPEAYGVRALLHARQGHHVAALHDCQRALSYKPHLTKVSMLAANLQLRTGHRSDAIQILQKALQFETENADLLALLGELERQESDLENALVHLGKAVELVPGNPTAWSNYGTALLEQGDTDAASAALNKALQLNPQLGEVANNLAVIAMRGGDHEKALRYLDRAIELLPRRVELLINKCMLLVELNEYQSALSLALDTLEIDSNRDTQSNFCTALQLVRDLDLNERLQKYLVRALIEGWSRPGMLAGIASNILSRHAAIREFTELKDPDYQRFFTSLQSGELTSFNEFSGNPLLSALLTTTPVVNIALEDFLCRIRRIYLYYSCNFSCEELHDTITSFFTDLARQCFINDYVFAAEDDEYELVNQLEARLIDEINANNTITQSLLIAYAMYAPLISIPQLRDHSFPANSPHTETLLKQQLHEPLSEQELAGSLRVVTPIRNSVTQQVRCQYEESPYPKWVVAPNVRPAGTINQYLRQNFPKARFQLLPIKQPRILIAGCGTGQQSIQTARLFPDSSILAVDLSLASLGYAKRKTDQLGISTVEYAQGDILELGQLEQNFEIIQSTGVLHHMEDPEAGWRVLLSLLVPGGVMKIALYSDLARNDIKQCQAFIADRGYRANTTEMRQCRQEIIKNKSREFGSILAKGDFYSLNACRDLLFHAQEHLFTVSRIARFLEKQDLRFLGFQLPAGVLNSYRRSFPDDPSATDLKNWEQFEESNPNTFSAMYQFWIQSQRV